ncbi:MAG TPA: hypothetical protein VNI02_23870 [Blastocatellia bacterium]|jgi:hypothetical protein|nr:hypothetical protein [Blastocatellia bacterium]
MRRGSEEGFTLFELMVSTGALLAVLSGALYFFARSQTVYSNERATLEMVQDLRTVFDRFTNEIRMAGAGLPGYRGVISGTANTLIVRGDFSEITTLVTSTGAVSGGTFPVGTTKGFVVGQTISLLDTDGPSAGASGLAVVSAVNSTNNTISIDNSSFLPITAGAQVGNFGPGCIINVVERRTYSIVTSGNDKGAITRTVTYEDTQNPGAVIRAKEIIANNVLDQDDNVGLTFTYYQADGSLCEVDESGFVIASQVAKVQITLNARTAQRDLESGRYRTLNLRALIQVRGQYIPRVGF